MQDAHYAFLVFCTGIYFLQGLTPAEASESLTEVKAQRSILRDDGTTSIPAFELPPSSFASVEATRFMLELQALAPQLVEAYKGDKLALRKLIDEKLYLPLIDKHNARYAIDSEVRTIGGIYTEVFTPKERALRNKDLVLVNLHGGGFVVGARTVGRIESIPIAATAGIKVISIDYRMAPEYKFPAASEDVAFTAGITRDVPDNRRFLCRASWREAPLDMISKQARE